MNLVALYIGFHMFSTIMVVKLNHKTRKRTIHEQMPKNINEIILL
jgi:hypothetical protein